MNTYTTQDAVTVDAQAIVVAQLLKRVDAA
jgi:hypothetical protein